MKKLLVALLALLGACASTRYDYPYSKEPDPRKSEYVIGVSDRLSITVWKNPDLSGDVVVRPDGTITLPLIGDITADGRTPTQLKNDIARQLTKFIRDDGAVVTVAVTGVSSYTVTVSGNVTSPGVFPSQKYLTVMEAVQLAGGPNRFASPREMRLLRRDRSGRMREIPVDYLAVLDGSHPEANLALISGDQIYMP
jgi:polysaccharide export outer membrane protein